MLTPLTQVGPDQPTAWTITLLGSQTVEGLGSTQGIHVRDGMIYLFGDAQTGVVRELRLGHDARRLEPTGRSIRLTHGGANLLPHPTGIAHHPRYGTFIGDTVRGRGVIWRVDWEAALRDGCLDRAVLNRCDDTAAVNGCRPEFVRLGDRWLLATSDYGPSGNEVRLYDPTRLAEAAATTDPGVLVARFPCGPWVQSLHWLNDQDLLILVQNQTCGRGYRLTLMSLTQPHRPAVIDLPHPTDELEGFAMLGPRLALLVSSSTANNAWLADVATAPATLPRAA